MVGLGHDLVILMNVRAGLSLLGIFMITTGLWMAERAREAQATSVTNVQQEGAYQDMEESNNNRSASQDGHEQQQQSPESQDVKTRDPLTTNGNWQLFELIGYLMLAISFTFSKKSWYGAINDDWVLTIFAVLVLVFVGVVQVYIVRKYIVSRQVVAKRVILRVSIGGGMLFVGILTSIIGNSKHALAWTAPVGALCVAVGPFIMWRCRKVGLQYDTEGTINANPVLYNLGGPIYMFGWFWFWVGMNATPGNPDAWFMPIYLSHRTTIAYVGVVLIMLSAWSTSYALDEASDKEDVNSNTASSAFGVEGYFCGDKSEIRLVIIFSWMIFGLAPFLPYFSNMLPFCILLASIGVGVVLSMVQERGLRAGDKEELKRWMLMADITFCLFVLLLCVQGVFASIMSVVGATLVNIGTYFLHKDRKRGELWMESKQVNKNPLVFSFGVPLFSLGMLILGWGMSVPMGAF